jgi:cytochrome P450
LATAETAPDQSRDWDPLEPRLQRDPIAAYDDLRARCPVAHTDRWGGFWALTRYADVVSVAADSDTFITSVQNLVPASPRSGVPRRPPQVDPPEHAHFRRAMNPYFEAERVALLEPELRVIRVALEELLAHTTHFELAGPVDFTTWPEYGPKTLPIRLAD